jgi:hypothetical protein
MNYNYYIIDETMPSCRVVYFGDDVALPSRVNHAQFRTRSARWRAGTKNNKPKYYWSLKKRGKK